MYFYMTNADMAFTPVKVHANVTSYICLTVLRGAEYISCVRCARVVNELASFSLPYLQCNEKITVAFMQKG